ncbi:PIN-like domain-containing protein [Rhodobacter capsulatus]|jgi:hypothetical protein|uniref:Conserved domain protein n=1 Tax=Rhodobacter capsulatus (strain ATCC BAA-309 / NBRC 16581 / SB1003) TaxID=272942 RepID=D5AQA8_RHOCB|nr:PIN domain-containing protein [Rhodobacter capsulatus]ADE84695.1 conserved domain protein [Rhodobacter capsulatus SB 1003]MDS0926442.1 PIN domain-containing protein [Rhodobacter capsulatus]TQD32439.1 hypothetical protein FKW81_17205 [Rhodobacter capsulatus]
MRDKFPWYFLTDKDFEEAWDKGTLTVDANVLLDLYRYNKATREALLGAIESFKGRLWISFQTSNEFVKNRRKVILDAASEFEKSEKHFEEIMKSSQGQISAIRGIRAVPKSVSEELEGSLKQAIETARASIATEKSTTPEYESNDEVVARLEAALAGNIGSKPGNLADLIKEAERRKKEKIPPGYMDDGKEGNGFAGDYLMWRQILDYGKQSKRPLILVTSEQKEDWWEKKSGKTLNARLELLQEAHEETGSIILIYQTERFLQIHQERAGEKANEDVLEDIREVSLQREPAVKIVQEYYFADDSRNSGRIRVLLSRPVRNFTASGRFDPNMTTPPSISAKLLSSPTETPNITLRANTGTIFDFNIHLHSAERGKILPEGEYLLEYEAVCGSGPTSSD